jgi:hypothetical protein
MITLEEKRAVADMLRRLADDIEGDKWEDVSYERILDYVDKPRGADGEYQGIEVRGFDVHVRLTDMKRP